MKTLCFRAYGALAACGTQKAGTVNRPTARHFGRGAILGVIDAALGIGRDDEDNRRRIAAGLLTAVAAEGPRRVRNEFRTVQTVEASNLPPFASRGDAFNTDAFNPVMKEENGKRHVRWTAKEGINPKKPGWKRFHTMVTYREHIEDGIWRIFLTVRPGWEVDLDTIAKALRRPAFELYLGRRDMPLGLPPDPKVVDGGLLEAIDAYPTVPDFDCGVLKAFSRSLRRRLNGDVDLAWDQGFPGAPEAEETRLVQDDPTSRVYWRFGIRPEMRATISRPAPAAKAAKVARGQSIIDQFWKD
ncbi:CRISPR system Cascade subunit CasD [Azospirillum lipoferum]|uniref:Type I-E CRISPR-associated protein Cas5/CasD n=1 Tax=Azospirillum lipoferum TaxID=193 RepID=A0A5A9GFB3_AZOLI|nr:MULTISPECIES: type I-E CRISPR-associated protein Cas5/CasD [Azospirillum]KAA0593120.1 hypothetical protein FZ942_24580 [Azospirillum lipoferum]MCP1613522.1 CRISPR system Cascade subunit CasD [Azospirillum lipoferum]MDW5532291.1 type I-E CRISPR-associated protein Cas5/CasD [Azospirillum sp. NL1]